MPRKKIKSPEDFGEEFEELKITKPTPYDNMLCGNPYIEEREVEEDKQTIPAEKKYSPEVEAVGKAMEAFCENPNKETEKELWEKSRELGRAIGAELAEKSPLEELQEHVEKCEKYSLENLQELEKKLRVCCTTETPTVITYGFTGDKTSLQIEFFDHIKVVADAYYTVRSFCMESKKSYLATAQKMLEVLKEWRGEQ